MSARLLLGTGKFLNSLNRLFNFFVNIKEAHNDKKNYGENSQAENNMTRQKALATARSMQATARNMENIIQGLMNSEEGK